MVLHEFSITMSLSDVDEAIEKLNFNEYYNLYYDQPIEQFPEENGYGFIELENTYTNLKIILEDLNDVNIQKSKTEIAYILNIKEEDIRYHLLEIQDWQQPFPLIDLNNGWFIQPTYSEDTLIEGKAIHFEPPRAFGSGLHQTTQDCLRMILRENLHGNKVLDIGTGAGLLSIAAALVGAEKVVSVDMEDVVTEVKENARLNKVESKITVIQGNALYADFAIDGLFDWIFINISAIEIKELQPFVDSHLDTNGTVILSGMVEWNYQGALELYKEKGYTVLEISNTDEWITALVTRK